MKVKAKTKTKAETKTKAKGGFGGIKGIDSPFFNVHRDRMELAEKCLCAGYTEQEVVNQLRDKWPAIRNDEQARKSVIFKIYESWAVSGRNKGREERRDLMRARLEFGYQRAMAGGEYASAVNFQKSLAKLDDLNNEGRAFDLSFAGINLKDRSALERRIKELAGRAPEIAAALNMPASISARIVGEGEVTNGSGLEHERAERAEGAGPRPGNDGASDLHSDGVEDVHGAETFEATDGSDRTE